MSDLNPNAKYATVFQKRPSPSPTWTFFFQMVCPYEPTFIETRNSPLNLHARSMRPYHAEQPTLRSWFHLNLWGVEEVQTYDRRVSNQFVSGLKKMSKNSQ